MWVTPQKAGGMKRRPGRPSIPVLSKKTDEKLCLMLAIGGTFVEAADVLDVSKEAIFMRMAKDAGLREQVYQARANGIIIRKMLLEDAISDAALLIVEDPRYTTLAIFAAKALLKWSDIPDTLDGGHEIKEVLARIVENKRRLAHVGQSPATQYLPVPVTQVKK